MRYGLDTFTGIRPTADLTVANFLGAIDPIVGYERDNQGHQTAVFVAELHAATTDDPRKVLANSKELVRTLIASGVEGHIFSQRAFQPEVAAVETCLRSLTTVSRILRLPTLKEKIKQSDNAESATVALAMYPLLMASDIALMRPRVVPTGRDQLPHLEITRDLIRDFNQTYGAELPIPTQRLEDPINVLALDNSGRKMSKSLPSGAIFLDDEPDVAARKIMRAITASGPGAEMDRAVDNLVLIGARLGNVVSGSDLFAIADDVKDGRPRLKDLKVAVADNVLEFLGTIQSRRKDITDGAVAERLSRGHAWVSPIVEQTLDHVLGAYWGTAE